MKSSCQIQATNLHCLLTQADKFRAQMCPLGQVRKGGHRSQDVTSTGPGARPLPFFKPLTGLEPLRSESSRSASICPQRKAHLLRDKKSACGTCTLLCQKLSSWLLTAATVGPNCHLGPKTHKKRTKTSLFFIAYWKLPDVSYNGCVGYTSGFWV